MASDHTYSCGLAEFIDKTIRGWARNKKNILEPKLSMNFEAVTNRDFRKKVWKKEEGERWRSTTWIGFVRVKVWAFYSLLLDTVLKAGKIPFTLEARPYDDEYMDEAQVQERDARIERMTDKIESQLAARKADREYMKKWLSGGYYGMAFSKFNVEPVKSTEFRQVNMDIDRAGQYLSPEEQAEYTRYELVREEEDTPGHRYVSVWNMVWDMEADNLQDGIGYAEHLKSSAYDLKQLMGKPGYLEKRIQGVIDSKKHDDGEDTSSESPSEFPGKADLQDRKQKFVRYEFYMRAPRKLCDEFENLIRSGDDDVVYLRTLADFEDTEEEGDDIEIMGEIVDKEIIRYIRNDDGRRPHHMWVVESNLDESTGSGIPDNMGDSASSAIGMIRAFEDNKKLSANVTAAVKRRFFSNPNQLDDIVPGKTYDIADTCDDVRKAFMPIVFPDVGETLLSGIELMNRLDDVTSMIPTIIQGFTLPKHKPDTLGEAQLLTEQAGKYIGQSIRNNDEQFIEPEVYDIFEYNMLYGNDESCKVNAKVIANGFTSFQNKEIRGARMQQILGLVLASEVLLPHVKIKPHLDVIYESMDEDPEKFINSEEEFMQQAQERADMQAEAEQKALQSEAALKEHESQLKMGESSLDKAQELEVSDQEQEQKLELAEQEHGHKMEQEDQKHGHATIEEEQDHINDMEEATLEAKLDDIYGQEPKGGENAYD